MNARQIGDMEPAAHLWQAGLRPADGRTCESVVALLDRTLTLRLFFAEATRSLGPLYRRAPFEQAHVTLAASEAGVRWAPEPFELGSADVMSVEATSYAFRLVCEQAPFAKLAAIFGLPKPDRPYGITLAYATSRIDAAHVREAHRTLSDALFARAPLTVRWSYVERQLRPGREPFDYQRLDSRRAEP